MAVSRVPALGKLELQLVVYSTIVCVAAAWFATLELWPTAGLAEAAASSLLGAPAALLLWLGWRAPRREAPWAELLLSALLAVPPALLLGALGLMAWFVVMLSWGGSLSQAESEMRALLSPTLAVPLPLALAGSAELVSTLGVMWLRARRAASEAEPDDSARAPTADPPGPG